MNQYQSPLYITPRIAIILLTPSSHVLSLYHELRQRHNKYFYIFNLTNFDFAQQSIHVPHTNFKWRDVPYSITQTIKILTQIDAYLRSNAANSAIICVESQECYRFALYVIQCYFDLLQQQISLSDKVYSLQQFAHIYSTISIRNPPVRLIESIEFQNPNGNFVPVFEIFTQTRYNNFESVYFHKIEDDLTQYYVKKGAPLNSGIGQKYYDQKPQTKYMHAPVIVYGDVKIVFYSYEKLVLKEQFVCGFNTRALAYDQTMITLEKGDLYEGQLIGNRVHIVVSNYCGKCGQESKCKDCMQMTKKIVGRYGESQGELQKLRRDRKQKEIKGLLSI